MTREEQAKKDCAIIVDDCVESGTVYASGYNKGIEMGVKWADQHPAIDFREKCCDVVRNTKMSTDLKEHLINTFMRL